MNKNEIYVNDYIRTEMPEKLYSLLKEKNFTITTAESCTGGLIGGAITSVSGISSYYKEGVITYSNEAKMKFLGVSAKTLESYGAVSPQTAEEMAVGAIKRSGADISVAVTGIAGPDGGTREKPVGLVYIAIADKNSVTIKENYFSGNRDKVREYTVDTAISMAIEKLS